MEKTTYHPEVFVEILRSPAQLQWRHASFRRSSFGLTRLNHPCRAYGNPATVSRGWFSGGKHALKEQSQIQKLCWIQKLGFRNSLRGIQKLSRQIQKLFRRIQELFRRIQELFRRIQKLLQERWKTPDQLNVLPAAPACTAECLSAQQLYREESCSLCQFHSVARVIVS